MAAQIVLPIPAVTGQPFGRHALPPNPYTINPCLEAFQQCLDREQAAGQDERLLVFARFLGWAMIEAPVDSGRINLAREIVDCGPDFHKLDKLAQLYITHVVRLFHQSKGHTPAASDHPSRPSFKNEKEHVNAVYESPHSHVTAKKLALIRDAHRCKLSGVIDRTTWDDSTPQERAALGPGFQLSTNYCHIFPPSINEDLNLQAAGDDKDSGGIWALVQRFSGITVDPKLNGDNIHNLTNGLTMEVNLHGDFDALKLWLEADANVTHRYTIRMAHPRAPPHLQKYTIDFTTTNPNLPLPVPRYLKLHAAICRITHLSGAAEYVKKFDRDYEAMTVLANDGSSALILEERLARLVLLS